MWPASDSRPSASCAPLAWARRLIKAREARIIQTGQLLCAVGEMIDRRAHAVEHRRIEIAQGRPGLIDDMPASLDRSTAAPGQYQWQVLRIVGIPIPHSRAEQHHRIVQQ